MATTKYLDYAGLTFILGKIKADLEKKVNVDGNKVLSTNDFTDELKTKLNTVAEQVDGIVSTGGEANLINSITVNGEATTIDINKNVDITIPTAVSKVSELTNDSKYQTEDEVAKTVSDAISGITVPTKTSELTNDDLFQTKTQVSEAISAAVEAIAVPENVSDLVNDSKYQTKDEMDAAISAAVEAVTVPTKVSELENDSKFQTEEEVTAAISAIEIPANVSEFTNDSKYQTEDEVAAAIAAAVADITGFNMEIVAELPETGTAGTIYLFQKDDGENTPTDNSYEEYIYVNGTFEKIGDTTVDLSGYVKKTDIASIEITEISTLWTGSSETEENQPTA